MRVFFCFETEYYYYFLFFLVCRSQFNWVLSCSFEGYRYQKTELVEINSHSLFSKWFSESGKLVHSLFAKIEQIAENTDVFVLVLIGPSSLFFLLLSYFSWFTFCLTDEVESLAGSRSSGASGGEPSDALRVGTLVLNQLPVAFLIFFFVLFQTGSKFALDSSG
jgi:hypothetical protein